MSCISFHFIPTHQEFLYTKTDSCNHVKFSNLPPRRVPGTTGIQWLSMTNINCFWLLNINGTTTRHREWPNSLRVKQHFHHLSPIWHLQRATVLRHYHWSGTSQGTPHWTCLKDFKGTQGPLIFLYTHTYTDIHPRTHTHTHTGNAVQKELIQRPLEGKPQFDNFHSKQFLS